MSSWWNSDVLAAEAIKAEDASKDTCRTSLTGKLAQIYWLSERSELVTCWNWMERLDNALGFARDG